MGRLQSSYKKAIFDELVYSISSNNSQYYGFVSNEQGSSNTVIPNDIYSSNFDFTWNMIFGKKLKETDLIPIIKKNFWTSNTVYDKYDNTDENLITRDNFYIITEPQEGGGYYHVYVCIDNFGNSASTVKPESVQIDSFITLPDNYQWKYITSISTQTYNKFATNEYFPIHPNTTISQSASINSGVNKIVVNNGGAGYVEYTDGIIQSNPDSSLVKLANNSSTISGFYNNTTIQIYNTSYLSTQIRTIENYVSNSSGRWVFVDVPLNTALIQPGSTLYSIRPKVVVRTDGTANPTAVSVVNTSSNSISSIEIYDTGANISWAEARIQSNYGTGANLYCIVPPPGGFGADPAIELDMKGYCIAFDFDGTEGNTIISSIDYNKIGLIKNPSVITINGSKGSNVYSSNTFSSLLSANVAYTFLPGETILGSLTGARGKVVFANSTTAFISGDKYFANGESVSTETTNNVTNINIISRGNIYNKDLTPLYIQNISEVTREENQKESFKIVIKL
jgi:hypothetical protein